MKEYWRTSYGWGFDESDGWGSRYFFTYYTTLGGRSGAAIAMGTILYVIILLLSVVANVAIIVIVLRKKEIKTVTNCFIVNLSVADLVFVMGIPAIIVARAGSCWSLGQITCKLLPYSQFVCGSVLLWTLTIISIDRVRCLVTSPQRTGLKKNTAIITCLASWLCALVLYIPVAVFFREQTVHLNKTNEYTPSSFARSLSYDVVNTNNNNVTICTLSFPKGSINYALIFTLPTIIISCLIPMTILVINYHRIFTALKQIRRRLEEKAGFTDLSESNFRQSVQTIASQIVASFGSSRSTPDMSRHTPLNKTPTNAGLQRLIKHKRSVRLLYFNVIAVLLMWLPMPIVMFLIYFDGHRWDESFFLTTSDFMWCVTFPLINTIVNPIFYGFLTDNFKKNFSKCAWFQKNSSNAASAVAQVL